MVCTQRHIKAIMASFPVFDCIIAKSCGTLPLCKPGDAIDLHCFPTLEEKHTLPGKLPFFLIRVACCGMLAAFTGSNTTKLRVGFWKPSSAWTSYTVTMQASTCMLLSSAVGTATLGCAV
jgi:hypothetical protein